MDMTSELSPKFEDSRILIVGTIRNGSKTLRKDIDRLTRTVKGCRYFEFFIVESDSSDVTLSLLQEFARKYDNFRYVSLGNLSESLENRNVRMAFCRNQYVNYIRSTNHTFDFVLVCDLDGLANKISNVSLRSCWAKEIWHACSANQDGHYYDIYALRHPIWSPNNFEVHQEQLLREGFHPIRARYLALIKRQVVIPKTSDWIEVDSAFGGTTLYKTEVFTFDNYEGYEYGLSTCEHVTFHAKLRKRGYRIFINPQFINAGITEHTKVFSFLGKLRFIFEYTLSACSTILFLQYLNGRKRLKRLLENRR